MDPDSLDLAPELIQQRLRWARAQGHPFYLWPDMPVGEWRASLREIERVTTHILADGSPPVLALPLTADTRKMGVAAFTSGMGALLGYWIEVGRLTAGAEVEDLLGLHLYHGRERARLLSDELHKALEVLGTVGIDPIAIKGAHTAHIYFPEPGTRPASDLDLVIGLDEVREASRALREAGYVETNRQGRPYKSDWVPPGASTTIRSLEVTHRDDPITVAPHHSRSQLLRGGHGLLRASRGLVDSAPPSQNLRWSIAGCRGSHTGTAAPRSLVGGPCFRRAPQSLHDTARGTVSGAPARSSAGGARVGRPPLVARASQGHALHVSSLRDGRAPGPRHSGPRIPFSLGGGGGATHAACDGRPSALQRPPVRGDVAGRAPHVGARSRRALTSGAAHAVAGAGGPFTEGARPRLRQSVPPYLPRSCDAPDIRRLGPRRTKAAPAGGGRPSRRPFGSPHPTNRSARTMGSPRCSSYRRRAPASS